MITLLAGSILENCLVWGGAAILPFQAWLLLPSKNYKIVKGWVRESGPGPHHDWIRYRTLKRFLTPARIAMNAVDQPEFTKEDLDNLNRLFGKLRQPEAEMIYPAIGEPFNEREQTAQNPIPASASYVGEVVQWGVGWDNRILTKAQVEVWTEDRLAMQRLLDDTSLPLTITSALQSYFDNSSALVPDFRLDSSLLQGVVQMTLTETETDTLFQALCDAHPNTVFVRVTPAAGEDFNGNTMATSGGEIAGMNCRVAEVRHSGLIRKDDPDWRIRALVKIKNVPR